MKWSIRRSGRVFLLPWQVIGWMHDEETGELVRIRSHQRSHARAVEFVDRMSYAATLQAAVQEAPC